MATIRTIPYLLLLTLLVCSCTTKNMTQYYYHNKKVLDSMEREFRIAYQQKPFSIQYTDKAFNNVSIEIITDSLKYIYEFGLGEKRMQDTLAKYHLRTSSINTLMRQMKSIHSIWLNNLDYYVDNAKKDLVFIAIRPVLGIAPFTNKKYFILSYFAQPQYFDSEGNLLDTHRRKRIRKINEDVFRRINDRVCYTISDRFR